MKKLLALSLVGSSFLLGSNSANADWDYWGYKPLSGGRTNEFQIFTINSSTGIGQPRTSLCIDPFEYEIQEGANAGTIDIVCSGIPEHNTENNTIFIRNNNDLYTYNLKYNSWNKSTYVAPSEEDKWKNDYSETFEMPNITSEGLFIEGNPLITKKDDGEIHIGKNSLITTSEEQTISDGRKVQPLYAKDADGNKIPINIDGSKLLIDGVEVTAGEDSAQVTTNKNNISTNTSNISTNTSNISTNSSNIKNLGQGVAGSTALTAALTALPQTSKESKLSCGVGTGAYSSRYAVGFGCASKVNERVDINAGGSYVFGGSKSYGGGTLDNGVLKAGFVFKLGELSKPTQISMMDTKKMGAKIESLEEKNKQLLARLERLEKIALGESKSKDLAIYKFK